MEKEEPIRSKLRTLGIDILSDISILHNGLIESLRGKTSTILSFLNMALDLNMISEMNGKILVKEFLELKQSLQDSIVKENERKSGWLEEFMLTPSSTTELNPHPASPLISKANFSIGHTVKNHVSVNPSGANFEVLKNKRREGIIYIIKEKKKSYVAIGGVPAETGTTITDIKNGIKNLPVDKAEGLISCGEKTLQRELVSMVKDNVLYKKGDKRWSQYFLK
jgi:hypothetical protein